MNEKIQSDFFRAGDLVVVRECYEIAPSVYSGVLMVLSSKEARDSCISLGIEKDLFVIYTVLTPNGKIVNFWDIDLEAY